MIVIICGKPRSGKTALNTYFAQRSLSDGNMRMRKCISAINDINQGRTNKLTLPDKPPIYTNYEAHFCTGYHKYFSPYFVNPYYIGLSNHNIKVQNIMPFGELHITEGQRYWDSRESSTLPDHVSRFFETHGHFWLDIFIDVQRAKLIDLNIRALAKRIIEVQRMVHIEDEYGRILQTTWLCREFSNNYDYETYVDGGVAPYISTRYVYNGNIFECFNSRSCRDDFVPKNDENFSLLPYLNSSDVNKGDVNAEYYSTQMPATFRAKPKS
jgi:hypothetical protein